MEHLFYNLKPLKLKKLISFQLVKQAFVFSALTITSALVWAQDSTTSATTTTNSTTETTTWYAQPWVWAVGAGVLILLIVALVKGSGNSTTASRTDKVTVTKTTDVE